MTITCSSYCARFCALSGMIMIVFGIHHLVEEPVCRDDLLERLFERHLDQVDRVDAILVRAVVGDVDTSRFADEVEDVTQARLLKPDRLDDAVEVEERRRHARARRPDASAAQSRVDATLRFDRESCARARGPWLRSDGWADRTRWRDGTRARPRRVALSLRRDARRRCGYPDALIIARSSAILYWTLLGSVLNGLAVVLDRSVPVTGPCGGISASKRATGGAASGQEGHNNDRSDGCV